MTLVTFQCNNKNNKTPSSPQKMYFCQFFHFILTGGDDDDVQSRKPETAPGLLPAANHHRGLGLPHHLVAVVLVAGSGKSWCRGVTIGRDCGVAGSMQACI